MRKTSMMKRVEEAFDEKLETLLPRLINSDGMSETADQIGTSKSSLGYWCLKLGIEVRRVALAPGETVQIRKIARR
ncbi:hypothetical protein CMI37_30575 [Candidatus Pacearchaeota archaeon]|nr:hypothetical protein [Candidatus Pacearchaeota archaeon]